MNASVATAARRIGRLVWMRSPLTESGSPLAYAQPLCTPTRMQLMTGRYNCRNWRAFGVMDPKEVTFGHWMGAQGYKTCIAGKWQLYSYNQPDYQLEW